MFFFGNSCVKGGNDYDIHVDIKNVGDGISRQVSSPEETLKIILDL